MGTGGVGGSEERKDELRDGGARLREALAAVSKGAAARQELQDAACALVIQLKREREAPEQVLLRIKRILAESGLRPKHAHASDDDGDLGSDGRLYRDIIAWCIEYYYRGDGSR
jgi:hypothetical protein